MSEVRGGGQEELPHVQGQGQKLGGPHAQGAAAKRSYPTSEVRGSGREELRHARGQGLQGECQAAPAQEQPRGTTQRRRSGAAPGREEQPHVQGAVAALAQ